MYFIANLIPISGPVDPGYGVGAPPPHISGGPIYGGGYPSHGLPGWERPVDPGYGHGGAGPHPGHGLPVPPAGGHIDNSLPAPPVGVWPPLNIELPDQGLPSGPRVKGLVLVWLYGQGWRWATLPVEPPAVDNTLPPTAEPKKK